MVRADHHTLLPDTDFPERKPALKDQFGIGQCAFCEAPTNQRLSLGLPVGCLCVAYPAEGVLNSVGIGIWSKKFYSVELFL